MPPASRKMRIAVITGASSGMGREFVRQLDAGELYDEIWVIARRRERLEALAAEVRAPLRILPLDLTKPESIGAYREALETYRPSVAVLVNASGFGRFGAFADFPLEDYYDMIDLNVKALVAVTHVTLPYLALGAAVYQIDSLSAFLPLPYINIYAATKAFVLSFSRALNEELKPRQIRVMAVCPGWVRTEFFEHAVRDDTVKYYNKFFNPDEVVRTAIKDMKRGRGVSICGFSVKMQVLGMKFLPTGTVMRVWLKQQKKI